MTNDEIKIAIAELDGYVWRQISTRGRTERTLYRELPSMPVEEVCMSLPIAEDTAYNMPAYLQSNHAIATALLALNNVEHGWVTYRWRLLEVLNISSWNHMEPADIQALFTASPRIKAIALLKAVGKWVEPKQQG